MSKDQRRARRQPMRRSAWVVLGPGDLRECTLFDVSDSGARIEIDDTRDIADEFVLFLSANGAARRSCQVVWREGRQLGVRVRKPAPASRKSRAEKPNAEAVTFGE